MNILREREKRVEKKKKRVEKRWGVTKVIQYLLLSAQPVSMIP